MVNAIDTPREPQPGNRDEGDFPVHQPAYRPFDHGAIHEHPGAWQRVLAHTPGSHPHPPFPLTSASHTPSGPWDPPPAQDHHESHHNISSQGGDVTAGTDVRQ